MTLALAHGQYSHHFRPLSSSEMRSSSSRSWHVASAVAPFPPPPAPLARSTCSSRVAGTGDWEYCSVGNLFYDLRAVSPGSDCATLALSLALSFSLGCLWPSHAWLLIMLIFLWPAQTRWERDFGRGRMDGESDGRTDGRTGASSHFV